MEFNFDGPSGTISVVLALLIGLGTIGYGAYSFSQQSSALDSAVSVDATINGTAIETHDSRRGTDYSPQATYHYAYEGQRYTTSNVFPGPLPRAFDSKAAARSQLDGYDPGDTVTAYVQPDDPGTAFLKHSSSNKPFIVMGIGGLFVLGSVYSTTRQ